MPGDVPGRTTAAFAKSAAIVPTPPMAPALTVVAPAYVLTPLRISVPAPDLVRPNVGPPTAPLTVATAPAPTFTVALPPRVAAPNDRPVSPLVTAGPADTFSVNAPVDVSVLSECVTPGPAV